jgi:hypothetical protein
MLPLVFNGAYHLGADIALALIFPAAIIQYVVMSPISEQLTNLATITKVTDESTVDAFLRERYRLLISLTAIASTMVAGVLFMIGPDLISHFGGSDLSLRILLVAASSNVLVAVFMANSVFLTFANRAKSLVAIAAMGLAVLVFGGVIFARSGFQDIVFAYLAAAVVTSALSSLEVAGVLRAPARTYFSRYL